MGSPLRPRLRCPMNGAADAHVRSAAADVANPACGDVGGGRAFFLGVVWDWRIDLVLLAIDVQGDGHEVVSVCYVKRKCGLRIRPSGAAQLGHACPPATHTFSRLTNSLWGSGTGSRPSPGSQPHRTRGSAVGRS